MAGIHSLGCTLESLGGASRNRFASGCASDQALQNLWEWDQAGVFLKAPMWGQWQPALRKPSFRVSDFLVNPHSLPLILYILYILTRCLLKVWYPSTPSPWIYEAWTSSWCLCLHGFLSGNFPPDLIHVEWCCGRPGMNTVLCYLFHWEMGSNSLPLNLGFP